MVHRSRDAADDVQAAIDAGTEPGAGMSEQGGPVYRFDRARSASGRSCWAGASTIRFSRPTRTGSIRQGTSSPNAWKAASRSSTSRSSTPSRPLPIGHLVELERWPSWARTSMPMCDVDVRPSSLRRSAGRLARFAPADRLWAGAGCPSTSWREPRRSSYPAFRVPSCCRSQLRSQACWDAWRSLWRRCSTSLSPRT